MSIDSLYRAALDGDEASERELFRYLTDRFRLFAQLKTRNQQDSEDIVQNALMTIAKRYRNIDFQVSFASWSYKVLSNKMLDYFKTQRGRERNLQSASLESERATPQDLHPDTRQQMLDCLKKVGRANGRFARILNLHYQGYNTGEICHKLGLKRSYFYVVLSRARSMLEACLEEGDVIGDG